LASIDYSRRLIVPKYSLQAECGFHSYNLAKQTKELKKTKTSFSDAAHYKTNQKINECKPLNSQPQQCIQ